MPRLFGTDGVRGVANTELTPELALRLGRAAGRLLSEQKGAPAIFVAGRDTRTSGPMLESALVTGLLSSGCEVLSCGILPTPAVAFLVGDLGADSGVVVSGSHNPPEHNGIKFFDRSGRKLSDAQEDEIESLLDASEPPPAKTGRLIEVSDAEERYIAHALASLEGRTLEGFKIVIDCANGASFRTSPRAFERAGAEVIAINTSADGTTINVGCGSTEPEMAARAVREHDADFGFAHDGDADRVMAIDERGEIVDGDAAMAILALELKEGGRLAGNAVAATVMANLGFRRAMAAAGIAVYETPVGDRYVSEALVEKKLSLGGEQSGHIITTDFATTGDGLITALRLAGRIASSGRALSELAAVVERYPQVLLNVPVGESAEFYDSEGIRKAIGEAEERLGNEGRVLVRASGTEPVVRVMVEAATDSSARSVAEEIALVVRRELGGEA